MQESSGEEVVGQWIEVVGIVIDVFGVLIIVVGMAWASWMFLRYRFAETYYERYRLLIGRSLLLGLEVTVALDLKFSSLGVLALLVLVRTFLGWTLKGGGGRRVKRCQVMLMPIAIWGECHTTPATPRLAT